MVDYDPYSDAVMRDPFPVYAELRREAPVFYHEKYDTWFLSKFEDIWTSTSMDLFTAEQGVAPEMVLLKRPPPPDPVFSMLDMPRQRDYRRMFVPRYTRRAANEMEADVRAMTREILEPLAAKGSFDVYRDLADPLATRITADLIGIPEDETFRLRALVAKFFEREPGQIGGRPENEKAGEELIGGIAAAIQKRMEEGDQGRDDHISVMMRTEAEGKPLSLASIIGTTHTLLVTGVEVVTLAVANTIYYLWQHPDQRSQVVADRGQVPHAFAESLRYDQPTNLLGRFVKGEVEMRGQKLQPGQGVMFLWASGNRDEEEFDEADRFDLSRRPKRSLSFGHGYHKCIGEHLGNLEGRVLLEEILAVAPEYEVTSGAERAYSEFLHGYHRMPIEFAPR